MIAVMVGRPSSERGARRWVALMVLASAFAWGRARADSFDVREHDTQAHLAASYSLSFTIAVVARRFDRPRWQAIAIGAATTLVAGTLKEWADESYAWSDQLANAIGIAVATIVVVTFRL